jgi:hypothetical protein
MRRIPPRDQPPRSRLRRDAGHTEGPFDRLLRQRSERDPAPIIIGGTIVFLALVIVMVFLFSSVLGGGGGGGSSESSDTVEVAPGINGKLSAMPPLPLGLQPASQYIEFETEEAVPVTVALPLTDNSSDPTGLGFYEYTETRWQRVTDATLMPAQEFATRGCVQVEVGDDGSFVGCSDFESVPANLAILRALPQTYQIAASLPHGTSLHGDAGNIQVVSPRDYVPASDGSVQGTPTEIPPNESLAVIPTIVGSSQDTAAVVNDIVADEALRATHVQEITALAIENELDGVDLEYSSVDVDLESEFTSFATSLAESLHRENRKLSLTLPPPTDQRSAYNWKALGESADYIKILPLADPVAYWETMPSALSILSEQLDVRKVLLVISPYSIEGSGDVSRPIGYLQALAVASEAIIREPSDPTKIESGTTVRLVAKNLDEGEGASPMHWDEDSLTVTFATGGNDRRRVYIENSYSVSFKLELVQSYGLGGLAVADGSAQSDVANVWPTVRDFVTTATVVLIRPSDAMLQPIWQAPGGGDLGAGAGTTATWVAPAAGDYNVVLVVSEGERRIGQNTLIVVKKGEDEPSPSPIQTFAPDTETPTPVETPTEAPSETPVPSPGSVLVEVGKLADGDDEDGAFTNDEIVTPGSSVVYLITIDNDSNVPVTVSSLVDSVYPDAECLTPGGSGVVGTVLAPDDGDGTGVIDGGADEIQCTITVTAPDSSGVPVLNTVAVIVEDEVGNVDSDQDGATITTS